MDEDTISPSTRRAVPAPPVVQGPLLPRRRALRLGFLQDHPRWLDRVASWIHAEWGRHHGKNYADTTEEMRERMNRDDLPLTILAFDQAKPVGTASIVHDMCFQTQEIVPFLVNVFVPTGSRRRGVGAWLSRQAIATAGQLGIARLDLYTSDQVKFYLRAGWSPVDPLEGGPWGGSVQMYYHTHFTATSRR